MEKQFDGFTLKIFAIIGMILQHAALILGEVIPFSWQVLMHAAGGLTFPIMAFFLVEGLKHTSDVSKYLERIFVVGIVAQIFFVWAYGHPFWFAPLNIMFLLWAGLLIIHLHQKMEESTGFFGYYLPFSSCCRLSWNGQPLVS